VGGGLLGEALGGGANALDTGRRSFALNPEGGLGRIL